MPPTPPHLKDRLHRIINDTDSPEGRLFDILLILSIVISSTLIVLESVESIRLIYGGILLGIQSVFLAVFTIEYALRILVAPKKRAYLFSFFGLVDLLAILPFYLTLFMPAGRLFPVIRTLRLLRLFTVFKMNRYVRESGHLLDALRASRTKITVFLVTIFFIIVIVGAMMYVVEGPPHGFVSIPESMYWAVVTVSTVGYGDISPQTTLGKLISSVLMIIGYSIIAVPTGIITSELAFASRDPGRKAAKSPQNCPHCSHGEHLPGSIYCHMCGGSLLP